MWTRHGRRAFMQQVRDPRVRDVFVLFSYIPAGPVASPLPVTFPPPFFPPCLGRPHRAPGREVHEEDFPLNHKLSLSPSVFSVALRMHMCVYAKMGVGV